MKVRYRVDFGGGARGSQQDAVDAPDVGAEPDEAPAASDPEAAPQPRPVSRAARQLALAHHIDRLIDDGVLDDYAHAARVLGVTRARLSQVMALLHLAADIQEQVLAGTLCLSERRLRIVIAEAHWEQQHTRVRVAQEEESSES